MHTAINSLLQYSIDRFGLRMPAFLCSATTHGKMQHGCTQHARNDHLHMSNRLHAQ